MIALDASVLIGHLSLNDIHHEAATAILQDGGSLIVHSLTMAEVLVGGVRIGRGAAMRDDLLAAGIMVAEGDHDEPLRLAELRATTTLKLPDCCVLAVALHHHAALATFDATLAEAARQRGVRVLPSPGPRAGAPAGPG